MQLIELAVEEDQYDAGASVEDHLDCLQQTAAQIWNVQLERASPLDDDEVAELRAAYRVES